MTTARDLLLEPNTDSFGNFVNNILPNSNGSAMHGNKNDNGNEQTGLASVASSLPDHYATHFEKSSRLGNGTHTLFSTQLSDGQKDRVSSAGLGPIARPRSYSTSHTISSSLSHNNPLGSGNSLLSSYFKTTPEDSNAIGSNGTQRKNSLTLGGTPLLGTNSPSIFGTLHSESQFSSSFRSAGYPTPAETVESVVGSALDDLSLDDIHNQMEAGLEKESQQHSNNNGTDSGDHLISHMSRNTMLGSTAPVNIPGKALKSSSNINGSSRQIISRHKGARIGEGHRNIGNLSPPLGASPLTSIGNHQHGLSPFPRSNSVAAGTSVTSSFYDFMSGANLSPSNQAQDPASNVVQAAVSMLEIQRLERELQQTKSAMHQQKNVSLNQ